MSTATARTSAVSWLVGRSTGLGSPRLAAGLLARAIRPRFGAGPRTILALEKSGLLEDLAAALPPERYRVEVLDRGLIKAMARQFLPDEVTDNYYRTEDPAILDARRRYRTFLIGMLRHLRRRHRIDALVSANFAYFAERELHAACEAENLPFVVMHKENLKTPGRQAFWSTIYRDLRGPFEGRHLLVYNEIERDLEIACDIAPVEHITLTGMPRLDRVHALRRRQAGERRDGSPTVLFFYFGERTGLPFIPRFGRSIYADKGGVLDPALRDLNWRRTAEETSAAITALARAHPDIRVIVKGKVEHDKAQTLEQRVAGDGPPPANMTFVKSGDPLALIAESDVVCGFVSTALLESLAAGRPVVVPAFGEAADPAMADYLLDLGPAAHSAATPEDLAEHLQRLARARATISAELPDDVRAQLRFWTGNDDGAAGRRVEAAFERLLDGQQDTGARA